MELRQLEYFLELGRTRSFTKAAQNLSVSQPSITKAVQQLEQELGVTLFDRNQKPIAMTPRGQLFFERVSAILQSLQTAAEEVSRLSEQVRCPVRIGLSPWSGYRLKEMLADKAWAPPRHLLYNLAERSGPEVFRMLQTGSLDLGWVIDVDRPRGLRFLPLETQEICCLLPLITGLCQQLNIKRTKVIYPVMVIALTWIFLFPVGMGASTIAQMNGYLESFGSEFRFNMMDMTIGRLPGVILNTLFCIFILPRVCPDKPSVEFRDDLGREVAKSTLSKPREILCYIIAVVMVALMILAGTIGIQVYTVAIVGASALTLFGILSEKEAFQSINFGMVFFFAAILPLSTALTKTGASDVIADAIITILGGSTNPWLISTVFVLVCFVATQFLSNTGCVQVFTPLALMVCVQLNMNPVGIMSLVNIGCCASYLTPMANPGIPLTMSAGGYSLKDCIKIGILPGLLICAIGVVWCSLFFPAY